MTASLLPVSSFVAVIRYFPCYVSLQFAILAGQFTDDDAPPLPWSIEVDEEILITNPKGLFLCLCLVYFVVILWAFCVLVTVSL